MRAEVHLHCCHSVSQRKSDVTGDYRPILPLLRDARVDRVKLEFAYPGTGDVGDLRLLPDHLGLGMGVVDVRRESVPSVEEIEALGAAGAGIVAPERMALNPDCGFAPDAGEPPTIDEAYEKLTRLVAAAQRPSSASMSMPHTSAPSNAMLANNPSPLPLGRQLPRRRSSGRGKLPPQTPSKSGKTRAPILKLPALAVNWRWI